MTIRLMHQQHDPQTATLLAEELETDNAIANVHQQLLEINSIFCELSVLIDHQESTTMQIEDFIQEGEIQVKAGLEELKSAKKKQKTKRTLFTVLSGAVVATIAVPLLLLKR